MGDGDSGWQFWVDRGGTFTDLVARRPDGTLSEAEFRPLRLLNGLYLQLHAYMLRVAVPYGTLNSRQMRQLAMIAEHWDKGYGHFTTRQNVQFNWPELGDVPDMLDALADVARRNAFHVLSAAIGIVGLAAAALLDAALYAFAPRVVICYVCGAEHRGFALQPKHPRFDREIDERLKFGGKAVRSGNIICRQRGTKWWPGENVGLGKDHTIFATAEGNVRFAKGLGRRTYISVDPVAPPAQPS